MMRTLIACKAIESKLPDMVKRYGFFREFPDMYNEPMGSHV